MTEATTAPHTFSRRARPAPAALSAGFRRALTWSAAVLLSVYLALSGGGYDIVVRSEIGLVVWWFVLLGVLVGVLPRSRIPHAGWMATGLLAAFLIWSWLGLSWSSSHELTLAEVARLSTYLGVFLIGLCALTPDTSRSLVNGLGCGIVAVSSVAVLYKLAPGLFPADSGRSFYNTPRLLYPFDYADGVGEYAALGIPLVLHMATGGRTLLGRSLAAAGLPPVLLCLAMTVSRGGILAAGVGVIAFLALVPNRLPRLPTLVIAAVGISALMVALLHRPALRDSISAAPAGERHSMLALLCIVAAASAAAQALLAALMGRLRRPHWLQVSRRAAQAVTAAIVLAVIAAVLVAFGTGAAGHVWHDFKLWEPAKHSNQYFRLLSVAGSHRYQYWQIAWKAFESSPLHGIGSGTYRYYWYQHSAHAEFILNAHSLWFETLAETGVVGWLLLAGFFGLVALGGIARALRSAGEHRALVATSTAAVFAFCAAASFDWIWQIGVVPMVMLLLASVSLLPASRAVGQPAASGPRASSMLRRTLSARPLLALGSVLALVLIAIPLASTVALRSSQSAAAAGHLAQALRDAGTAQAIEPAAASPYLQRALVLEQAGDIAAASIQIRAAIAHSPEDYALWMIASRIATEADHPRAALADYRRARALYPTSTYFIG